jgi:hypothetical protein
MPRPDPKVDLTPLDGLFVGLLSETELAAFDDACGCGEARRSYEGVGGFLGLATVRLARADGAPQ